MNSNDMYELISNALNKIIDDERYAESIIEDIEDISNVTLIDEDWDDQGKFSNGDMTFQFTYDNEKYYMKVSQMRSGSYYSEYFYSDIQVYEVETYDEYHAPKVITSFKFRDDEIQILNDNTCKVLSTDKIYRFVEEAINSLI